MPEHPPALLRARRISAQRRAHALATLSANVSLRVKPASLIALIDAAADALAAGRLGVARDLLEVLCRPSEAEHVMVVLLGEEPG